jgi:hypothetical protein
LEVEHIVDEEGEIIHDDVMRAIGAVLKHVVVSKDSVLVVSLVVLEDNEALENLLVICNA